MVVVQIIVVCGAWLEAPRPSAGDARVVEIGYFVVGHLVVGTSADPDTVGAVEQVRTVMDETVVHNDALRRSCLVQPPAAANVDAATAQIVDMAAFNPVIFTAGGQPESVSPGMGDRAVLEARVAQSGRHDQPGLIDLALPGFAVVSSSRWSARTKYPESGHARRSRLSTHRR